MSAMSDKSHLHRTPFEDRRKSVNPMDSGAGVVFSFLCGFTFALALSMFFYGITGG